MNNSYQTNKLWKKRDQKKRLFLKKKENLQILKKISSDILMLKIPTNFKKLRYQHCLSKTTIRNKCLLSGASSNVLSQFKLCRFNFRIAALNGLLTGIRNAVW